MWSERLVTRAWQEGRRRHPEVELERADFERYLLARPPSGQMIDHAADLYLTCACLRRVPGAATKLHKAYIDRVPTWLGTLARSREFAADVQSELTRQLLVGDDGKPKLAEYAGRGSLEGWVRLAASRLAQDIVRAGQAR